MLEDAVSVGLIILVTVILVVIVLDSFYSLQASDVERSKDNDSNKMTDILKNHKEKMDGIRLDVGDGKTAPLENRK